jgi:uroporphyrinogen-III decarboxylase
VAKIKKECPHVPLVLYINGNGGLLERMKDIGVDVIGLDWTVDMADGRRRVGDGLSVQGNVDPAYLFSPLPVLTDEIHRLVETSSCTYFMFFIIFIDTLEQIVSEASNFFIFLFMSSSHHRGNAILSY